MPGSATHRPPPTALLLTATCLLLAACSTDSDNPGGDSGPSAATPPAFQVDPSWPQELPNDWILGSITSVFVDDTDHVWITHLPETLTPEEIAAVQDPPLGECCAPAPVVIELDPDGRVVQAWGDPATQDVSEFPRNSHGLFIDHNGFVWIGTYRHHRVMKFTRDGQLVMTIGAYDENGGSGDTALLGGPAGVWVDPATNEVYVADGYRNRRVIVFDGDTGAYLRHWGAYGEAPDDEAAYDYPGRTLDSWPPPQFSTVHDLAGSNDGLIYVADRRGNRIQVFQRDGAFVTEKTIAPLTRASGSAFVIAFSPDEAQRWLYLADGTNHKVWILRRADLEVVGEFGPRGPPAGPVHPPARDGRRFARQRVRGRSVDGQARAAVPGFGGKLAGIILTGSAPATCLPPTPPSGTTTCIKSNACFTLLPLDLRRSRRSPLGPRRSSLRSARRPARRSPPSAPRPSPPRRSTPSRSRTCATGWRGRTGAVARRPWPGSRTTPTAGSWARRAAGSGSRTTTA